MGIKRAELEDEGVSSCLALSSPACEFDELANAPQENQHFASASTETQLGQEHSGQHTVDHEHYHLREERQWTGERRTYGEIG
jgi:hypothetical protein